MARDTSRPAGRREVLGVLGAGMLAAAATSRRLRLSMVDHLEFWVSDPQNSAAFYAAAFGNAVLKNNKTSRRYVKLGAAYAAMDRGPEHRVDHFCVGIEGFQISQMHSYLEERSIAYKDYPSGRDLSVSDPDGTRMQLAADNGWAQLLNGTASPESTAAGNAIFQPIGLDHVLLNVSDTEKSTAFYEKILGPVVQRNHNRIWFQAGKTRIGLLPTPGGQRPGVNHFCVSAAPFDYDAVMQKLKQAGAEPEAPEVKGAPEFRDPDGYLVQVMRAR
jgi:catechol 2,3-dioxygenase-like lactoylglutathione lyase family enzyme